MFTGIVMALGEITAVRPDGDAARITIAGVDVSQLQLGDSIAVDGVCVTASSIGDASFTADLLPETRRRTSLGDAHSGRPVNLELAATPMTRLGGHLVQGHIDGVGRLARRSPGAGWDDVVVTVPHDLVRYVVPKGSIALDGVSLTVVAVDGDDVSVSLIPETLRRTTFGAKQVGDGVNVEVDVIGKYVERLLTAHQEQPS